MSSGLAATYASTLLALPCALLVPLRRLVPRLDSTGSKTFSTLVNKLDNKGVQVGGAPREPSGPLEQQLPQKGQRPLKTGLQGTTARLLPP